MYRDEAFAKSKVVRTNNRTPKLPKETCLQSFNHVKEELMSIFM